MTKRRRRPKDWINKEIYYENALAAIRVMFSDSSVSAQTTILNLSGLKDEIDIMIDSIEVPNE